MMRDDKLLELFDFYADDGSPGPEKLVDADYKDYFDLACAGSTDGEDVAMRRKACNHAAWMATEAKKFIIEAQALEGKEGEWELTHRSEPPPGRSKREKAHRWLGFIQAALWLGGMYSLDELKNHSRKCSLDDCEVCGGCESCTPGNENIIDGKRTCDCCHAKMLAG